jgi:hypothetical protein
MKQVGGVTNGRKNWFKSCNGRRKWKGFKVMLAALRRQIIQNHLKASNRQYDYFASLRNFLQKDMFVS